MAQTCTSCEPFLARSPLWRMLMLLALLNYSCNGVESRQIRISRYNVEVEENTTETVETQEQEVEATVREVTPYPASGYRPGRAFKLPNEENLLAIDTTTTETSLDTTTTKDLETTTTFWPDDRTESTDSKLNDDDSAAGKIPYPASGFRPNRAFNLPTEEQKNVNCTESTKTQPEIVATEKLAPYPAAGYRPCRAFNLPNEAAEAKSADVNLPRTNTQNPACGVSTNPLAPKPPAGTIDDPDAERVSITAKGADASVAGVSSVPASLTLQQPIVWPQPLIITQQVAQPFVYTAHLQTW